MLHEELFKIPYLLLASRVWGGRGEGGLGEGDRNNASGLK